MSIRTKLLILLLVIAVGPMLVVLAVGQISTRLVGNRLTERTQADLVSLAEVRLRQGAEAAARLAASESQQINLVVLTQAHAAAEALEKAAARADDGALPEIYLAREDFDGGRRTPPGLEEDESGRRVSFEAQSFVVAPGVDPAAHGKEIRALQSMTPVYAALRGLNPGLIESQYTATTSGVHGAYPGHGNYPEGFDPRQRPWYRIAMDYAGLEEGESAYRQPIWGTPFVDATTGRVIISVSLAVRGRDGTVAGVTSVDIVLRNLIEHFQRQPTWTDREELLVVSTLVETAEGDGGLPIYAQRSYEEEGGDWRRDVALQRFRLDDPQITRRLVEDVERGRAGVARSARGGTEILCAYAPIVIGERKQSSAALIFTVPFADVVAIADAVHDEFWSVIVTQLSSNLTIALLVLGVVAFVAFRGARSVTRPVEEVAGAVERVAQGDLEARAEVHRDDEIGRLARHFNEMVPKLRDRVQLRQALDLAMEVQQALLPGEAPEFPGFDIDGRSIYCDETGGDYYDFLVVHPFDRRHLGVVMGDVTGHGISAALLMTTARAILRSRVALPGSLAEHVVQMNSQLAADGHHGRFMTMCFLLVDVEADRLRWVLAGHDPPIVYDPADDECRELDDRRGGIPLGIDGSWRYEEHEGPLLAPGQVLLVGTDGIWEARNEREEMFGKDRLREVLRANAARTAREISEAVIAANEAFRGDKPQLDDITLVVIKRTA